MELYSELSDADLLGYLRSGDHSAYTQIYKRYWGMLYLHAVKMVRDSDGARDVVQDVFVNLWKIRADLKLHASLKSYLFGATRNQVLMVIKHSKVHDRFMEVIGQHYEEGASVTEEELSFKQFSELMNREIDLLPPRMKEIFLKSRAEGLSHRAIAQELNIAENTVKKTIYRTLIVLRSKLGAWPILFFYLWRR